MRNVLFSGEDIIVLKEHETEVKACEEPAAMATDHLSQTVFVLTRNGTLSAARPAQKKVLW